MNEVKFIMNNVIIKPILQFFQKYKTYMVIGKFYEYYQNHSNEFELDYLQEMPDDKWSYAPLNGAHYIK